MLSTGLIHAYQRHCSVTFNRVLTPGGDPSVPPAQKESLPVVTPGAPVGLLSRVHPLVPSQVRLGCGGKVTLVTFERLFPCNTSRSVVHE